MTRVIRRLIAGLATALAIGAPGAGRAQAQEETAALTTVILVRHAEKADAGDDPSLSEAGGDRARTLAHTVGSVPTSAIYATQFARTQETAGPLAARLGIDLEVVAASDDYPATMAHIIRERHRGQVVVVVSHSNTVPAIIDALGAGPAPAIAEDEYDGLFVVTLTTNGGTRLVSLRYGRPTP
jgi:broad specificity phosphatase PhoE